MKINVGKLDLELRQAGIPIDGCASDGRIDFRPDATDVQKQQAETIESNHDPIWYLEQRQKAYPSIPDQLDMIYWDRVNGTSNWKDMITAIKAKYPKV